MKILSIGNAIYRKRLDLCALTCAELDKENVFDELIWRIIAEGPELEKVKQMAPQSMEFLNRVEVLRDHYHWADVFVLPSYDEGFGLVYIESIMSGCPIIATAGEGAVEIVEQTGGGLLVDIVTDNEQSVANIKKAIIEISQDYNQYMNPEIVEKARNKMDPVRVQGEWQDLLEKCFGSKK
jgi:glycosyltransferase involved in cell wall biosynthesis